MRTFLYLCMVVGSMGLITGCNSFSSNNCKGIDCTNAKCPVHFIPTSGTGDQIAVKVMILDDDETRWLFGTRCLATKAELYLKLTPSATPWMFVLQPLNVGHSVSGSNVYEFSTPFLLSNNMQSKITVELLDDDELTAEETKLIQVAVEAGASLVCDSVKLYAVSTRIPISLKKKEFNTLVASGAQLLMTNMRQRKFKSLGYREYVLLRTGSEFIANPITIVQDGMRARCDIKFYLIAERDNKQ